MEGLTIEQKAKAYDKALSIAKGLYAKDAPDSLHLERMFPELIESEDGRIRKFLHHTFTVQYLAEDGLGKWHGEPVSNILAWLEKQGNKLQGKTNTAWSGKDEETILKMMFAFKARVFPSSEECDSFIDFLKSLKNKVQPKQERGDEDECYMSGFLNLTDD